MGRKKQVNLKITTRTMVPIISVVEVKAIVDENVSNESVAARVVNGNLISICHNVISMNAGDCHVEGAEEQDQLKDQLTDYITSTEASTEVMDISSGS